jgi:dephospho-CoA kinase
MTLNVALTGNIASGKSTVARLWRDAGVPVVSADDLARDAVAPGSEGLARVAQRFGGGVLAPDGSLDRAAMRDLVFRDAEARSDLEAIIHPEVWRLRGEWLAERTAEGHGVVISEIPLLFETRRETAFDRVVFVDAPEDLRLQRVVENRGLSMEEARRMAAAQMDPARKRDGADYVIRNAGSVSDLERGAEEVLSRLRREAEATPGDEANEASENSAGEGLMRLDLHMHTWGSWDCLSDPEAVLAAARARGVDRIALTDHNRLGVALEMAARYPDHVIPGEEVKTAEGIDVIGLYLSEEIPEGTPAREVIDRTRAQGGISYLPHPYAGGKGGGGKFAEELAPLVDVVEGFNGRIHSAGPNRAAMELARRHGKPVGVGSDAHTVGEVARSWVEVPTHPNRPEALLAALREGRVEGRSSSYLVHLASTWAKVRRHLPGAPGPA